MSSSTRCDAVSVSSQLKTYIAEVLAGVTLSLSELMPLNSGMSEVLQDLQRTCSVRLHCRLMWYACFLSVGCSTVDYEVLCSGLSK